MTIECRNKILHDLRKISLAINELIKDLDEIGEEVVDVAKNTS